jgi:uncharacterized membrane protein YsdA (DUF1294 family)
MAVLAGATAGGSLSPLVPAIYLAASVAAFFCYRADKLAAVAGHRRMPENTLLALGLLGGWPGALMAQHALRHKTRKASFQALFWTTVVINGLALYWIWSPDA